MWQHTLVASIECTPRERLGLFNLRMWARCSFSECQSKKIPNNIVFYTNSSKMRRTYEAVVTSKPVLGELWGKHRTCGDVDLICAPHDVARPPLKARPVVAIKAVPDLKNPTFLGVIIRIVLPNITRYY